MNDFNSTIRDFYERLGLIINYVKEHDINSFNDEERSIESKIEKRIGVNEELNERSRNFFDVARYAMNSIDSWGEGYWKSILLMDLQKRRELIKKDLFDKARKAEGTDEDIVFIYRKK